MCLRLPNLAEQFTANTQLAGIAGAHYTLGSCQDRNPKATKHAGNVVHAVVEATTRLAVTLNTGDCRCTVDEFQVQLERLEAARILY